MCRPRFQRLSPSGKGTLLPRLPALTPLLFLIGCADLLGIGRDEGPLELESVTVWPNPAAAGALEPLDLRFSLPLDTATLSDGISLGRDGRPVFLRYTVLGGTTIRVTPTDPLDFGTAHELTVTPALRSRGGKALTAAVSLGFTTEGAPLPSPSPDSLLLHVEALAHDSMRGRGSGSPDELRAAEYLRERYLAFGLLAPPEGMIQEFTAVSRRGGFVLNSRNVLAALPGSGTLADEWIVVGAHYDHIGFRGLPDDRLGPHNGADDNASGTAVVLEMARLMGRYVQEGGTAGHPRRSVLFAAWGAEEEGLLGSCHYVFADAVVPLNRTRALLNFDMVGRLRDDLLVVSGGETAQAWNPMVRNSNAPGLILSQPSVSSPSGTDHACFWQASIPWLGFFTLMHPEYHTPGDDVNLINVPGMERIAALALRVLTRLVVMPEAPLFLGPAPSR